jgi:hypothetical protein
MDTIKIEVAGELEQGQPLYVSCAVVRIPQEAIDEHEIVYRMRRTTAFAERGDLLIVEPRNTAFTGELVVAFRGVNLFLGRWWAKNGLRELQEHSMESLPGEFEVAGAVTLIVRPS